MQQFNFRFEALLRLREHQRDWCRQLLADVVGRDVELSRRRRRVEDERSGQMQELRKMGGAGEVNVDASATRRVYAGQLLGSIGNIERERALLAEQIEQFRKALVLRDQGVRSLEILRDKQFAVFTYEQERSELHEVEEAWRAVNASGISRC
jgi:flagellar export protein FliJ